MTLRDTMGLPEVVHPHYADRDVTGRFVPGHPGRSPIPAEIKRTRAEAGAVLVAYVIRNQDLILGKMLEKDPERLIEMALQCANECDHRAVPDLDPDARAPVDIGAIDAEAAARRAEQLAHEARVAAETWREKEIDAARRRLGSEACLAEAEGDLAGARAELEEILAQDGEETGPE